MTLWFYPHMDADADRRRVDRRAIAAAASAMASCTPKERKRGDTRPKERSATERFHYDGKVSFATLFHSPAAVSAARHQEEGRAPDAIVARLLMQLWNAFFADFRDDERGLELPYFQEEASSVQERLDALPLNALPDLVTCRQMIYLLVRFEQERFAGMSERLEELVAQTRSLESELQKAKLSDHYNQDELERARMHLDQLLRDRRLRHDDVAEASLVVLLDRLIASTPQPLEGGGSGNVVAAIQSLLAGDTETGRFLLEGEERFVIHQVAALLAERNAFQRILQQQGIMPAGQTMRLKKEHPPAEPSGDGGMSP